MPFNKVGCTVYFGLFIQCKVIWLMQTKKKLQNFQVLYLVMRRIVIMLFICIDNRLLNLNSMTFFGLGLQYVANVLKLHRNDFEECGKTVGENLAQCIRNLCNDIKCATVLIQQEHRSQFISQPNGAQDENSTLIQTLLNEISFCLKQGTTFCFGFWWFSNSIFDLQSFFWDLMQI